MAVLKSWTMVFWLYSIHDIPPCHCFGQFSIISLGCLCLFYHSSFQLSVLSNIFLHVSKELCLFLPYKGSIFGFHLCAATRNTVIISLCWVLMFHLGSPTWNTMIISLHQILMVPSWFPSWNTMIISLCWVLMVLSRSPTCNIMITSLHWVLMVLVWCLCDPILSYGLFLIDIIYFSI